MISKKTIITLAIFFISLAVSTWLFSHYLIGDDDASPAGGENAIFNINNIKIKKLDIELFEDDKFKELESNYIKFKDLEDLERGKENIFSAE